MSDVVLTSSCSDIGLGGHGGRRRTFTADDAKISDVMSATKPSHSARKRLMSRCVCSLMHLLTYALCGSALFWIGPESVSGSSEWYLAAVTLLTMAFSAAAIGSLWMATMLQPGKVPQLSKAAWRERLGLAGEAIPWCSLCNDVKPPEAHHCSTCGVCVMGLDHHCIFINNCVGGNYSLAYLLCHRSMTIAMQNHNASSAVC